MVEPTSLRIKMLTGAAFAALVATVAAPQQASAQDSRSQTTGGLEQIVVTAQRRSENLQEVPISVSAVTADSLKRAGISSTKFLPQIIPAVQFSRSGPTGMFYMRGIGVSNGAAGEEGANAIYVDGVYQADLNQSVLDFNNIERVEVLKGPQGTLFGRNATGGLIHVITKEPGEKLEAQGQIGYANYAKPSGQLYVGGPVSDKVSADLAVLAFDQHDGWGRNRTRNRANNTQSLWSVRSKVVYRASDDFKLTFGADYTKTEDDLAQGWHLINDPNYPGIGGTVGPGGYDTFIGLPSTGSRLKIWGLSVTAQADLGFADLTSVTAMRQVRNESGVDVDAQAINLVSLEFVARNRSYQQELRLASKNEGPLSWQVGVFYLRSEVRNDQSQFGLAFAGAGLHSLRILAAMDTNSYAGFGEVTYAITPTTKITGGIRYTRDERKFNGGQTPMLLNGTLLARSTNPRTSLGYGEPTYRAAIRQDLTDDMNVYFSFNRSFKSGSYNLQSPLTPPVLPQFINAYELGLKSEWFDRKLRLNLAAYHYDVSDFQVRATSTTNPGASLLLNAATVKVDGVDVEFEAAPTDDWRLFGGFTVLNARFAKFGGGGPTSTLLQAPIVYANPATCPLAQRGTKNPGVITPGPRTGGVTACLGEASGNRDPVSPRFVGTIGTSYTAPVGNEGEIQLSLLYTYNSGYKFESDNVFGQGNYNILSGSLEYRFTPRYAIELWGNNITNDYYVINTLGSGTGPIQISGAPRTFGVNLKFNW